MPRPDLAVTDHLLTTTRAVRRRLDLTRPVEPELIRQCIEVAVQAPSGGNAQTWHWIVVTDGEQRRALASLYRRGWDEYRSRPLPSSAPTPDQDPTQARVATSAQYLADHLQEVPVMVVPCVRSRDAAADDLQNASGMFGSIYPAVWSLLLAGRARGLGGTITTLHLIHAAEAAELLSVPDGWLQVALVPMAHTLGDDFRPAPRRDLDALVSWDRWARPA